MKRYKFAQVKKLFLAAFVPLIAYIGYKSAQKLKNSEKVYSVDFKVDGRAKTPYEAVADTIENLNLGGVFLYGALNKDDIDDIIIDVTTRFGGGLNKALLLAETCAAETNYGAGAPSEWSDVGLMQFTTIGFQHVKDNATKSEKQTIFNAYGIDFELIKLSDLRYSPLLSVICAWIYYRTKGSAPADLTQRANFWKKYYNSVLGAGTPEHYIRQAELNQRPRIYAAF